MGFTTANTSLTEAQLNGTKKKIKVLLWK
jgi:hypothetical protein